MIILRTRPSSCSCYPVLSLEWKRVRHFELANFFHGVARRFPDRCVVIGECDFLDPDSSRQRNYRICASSNYLTNMTHFRDDPDEVYFERSWDTTYKLILNGAIRLENGVSRWGLVQRLRTRRNRLLKGPIRRPEVPNWEKKERKKEIISQFSVFSSLFLNKDEVVGFGVYVLLFAFDDGSRFEFDEMFFHVRGILALRQRTATIRADRRVHLHHSRFAIQRVFSPSREFGMRGWQ